MQFFHWQTQNKIVLQSSQILCHFPLGEKLSTKETLPSLPAWCLEVTGLCLSPGVSRGTLLTLTQPWPPPCWARRQAFSWSPLWTIPTLENTPAGWRVLWEFPHILQNLKSMVKLAEALKIFYFRKTCHSPILLWKWDCQPRRLCPAYLCGIQRWQTSVHHLESQGGHY